MKNIIKTTATLLIGSFLVSYIHFIGGPQILFAFGIFLMTFAFIMSNEPEKGKP